QSRDRAARAPVAFPAARIQNIGARFVGERMLEATQFVQARSREGGFLILVVHGWVPSGLARVSRPVEASDPGAPANRVRRKRRPSASRSQVSAVTPASRSACLITLSEPVLGNSSMTRR